LIQTDLPATMDIFSILIRVSPERLRRPMAAGRFSRNALSSFDGKKSCTRDQWRIAPHERSLVPVDGRGNAAQ
jgi:hypothetical protein